MQIKIAFLRDLIDKSLKKSKRDIRYITFIRNDR